MIDACACRGRGAATLEGLRKRMSSLFLQLAADPTFNPEAAQLKSGTNIFSALSQHPALVQA